MIGSFDQPLFAFGLSSDPWALGALVIALLLAVTPRMAWLERHQRRVVAALSLSAGALSWLYRRHYLDGASRVIDATTYLLQARIFSLEGFCAPVAGPTASFRGRFVMESLAEPGCVGGIFPPGYPALLAFGVELGAPALVGVLLAMATVWLTARWAGQVHRAPRVQLVAAVLSASCVNLRYQTADTMSHGLSVLLTLVMVSSTTTLIQSLSVRVRLQAWATLGLAAGWLLATRQWTGILVLTSCALAWMMTRGRRQLEVRGLAVGALALLPGLCLVLLQHERLTGSWWLSPQIAYYARADGPVGCFGLGLGKGCHFEHADVVAMQGGQGLTLAWAALNTLHRFHWHALDVAHFEPLFALGVVGAWWLRPRPSAWPGLGVLCILPLGYSLFYFNGSYPGGGARLFSEMLPLWHVALAVALVRLQAVRLGLVASALGFATHAWVSHAALATAHFGPAPSGLAHALAQLEGQALSSEEPGQKPAAAATAGAAASRLAPTEPHGREHSWPTPLFVTTAHDFNRGFAATASVDVVRETYDSRSAWFTVRRGGEERLRLLPSGELERIAVAPRLPLPLTLETEFDYPVQDVTGAWVHPAHLPLPCVSRGAALAVRDARAHAQLRLELLGGAAEASAEARVTLHFVRQDANGELSCAERSLGRRSLTRPLVLALDEFPALTHLDRVTLTAADE